MKRIFIFAYNGNGKQSPMLSYKGYFDGSEFIPKVGSCTGIDELYEYDNVDLFGDDGLSSHIPKRFYGDLVNKMKDSYARVYGYEEEQMNLF